MSDTAVMPPPLPDAARAPSQSRTLRKLFLTLFLRGRTARGLRRENAPKSVGRKLWWMLGFYALLGGFISLGFWHKPVFALSLYLHSMTFVFLGMFVASSAGEVLFNKDEADILMHRPVTAKALLWAKVGVLVQISLWMAGAFNLAGLYFGTASASPGWLYPVIHIFSTACQALFCTGSVVLVYQLCLRWFGRERLDGLMTSAQVFLGMAAVLIGQMPQVLMRWNLDWNHLDAWWLTLLPPAWFAGMDDALAGTGSGAAWLKAGLGFAVTVTVLGLAFGKLARSYEVGLQTLNEVSSNISARGSRRRWIAALVKVPPFRWWLRNSVARASFVLTAAYLVRDRDVKLRMYPGIMPMLVMPFIFLLQPSHHVARPVPAGQWSMDGYAVAFAGAYLGMIPFLALRLLRYSQQWQAADLFRIAPLPGPVQLCHGARRAILFFLTFPMMVVFAGLVLLLSRGSEHIPLLIPGLLLLPVYSMIPCLRGGAVPLSLPTESAKAAGRGLSMIGIMMVSGLLALGATFTWSMGYFRWFVGGELVVGAGIYFALRAIASEARWPTVDEDDVKKSANFSTFGI